VDVIVRYATCTAQGFVQPLPAQRPIKHPRSPIAIILFLNPDSFFVAEVIPPVVAVTFTPAMVKPVPCLTEQVPSHVFLVLAVTIGLAPYEYRHALNGAMPRPPQRGHFQVLDSSEVWCHMVPQPLQCVLLRLCVSRQIIVWVSALNSAIRVSGPESTTSSLYFSFVIPFFSRNRVRSSDSLADFRHFSCPHNPRCTRSDSPTPGGPCPGVFGGRQPTADGQSNLCNAEAGDFLAPALYLLAVLQES